MMKPITSLEARYAFRSLLALSTSTIIIILVFGISLGACIAVYLNFTSLSPKSTAYDKARLVLLGWRSKGEIDSALADGTYSYPGQPSNRGTAFSRRSFELIRQDRSVFSSVIAFAPLGKAWYGENEIAVKVRNRAVPAVAMMVSGNFFDALAVTPAIGTVFTETDAHSEAPVAVISYNFWKRIFADNKRAIGKGINIEGTVYSIVAIAPKEFTGLVQGVDTDIWIPLSKRPNLSYWGQTLPAVRDPHWWGLTLFARMKTGITFQRARAAVQSAFEASLTGNQRTRARDIPQVEIRDGRDGLLIVSNILSKPLTVFSVCAVILVLISALNVISLVVARTAERRVEFAICLALGSTTARLALRLVIEYVSLALCSAAIGIVFSYWLSRTVAILLGNFVVPFGVRVQSPAFTAPVIGSILLICIGVGVALGIATASTARYIDKPGALSGGPRVSSRTRRVAIADNSLLILQIAVSLTLLTGAGVFFHTVNKLLNENVGFNTNRLMVLSTTSTNGGEISPEVVNRAAEITDRFSNIPGVMSATASLLPPLAGRGIMLHVMAVGSPGHIHGHLNLVGANFFRTLATPMLLGRDFTDADSAKSDKVAIVSRYSALKLFGQTRVLGHTVSVEGPSGPQAFTIVGVVPDIAYESIYERLLHEPRTTIFIPYSQLPLNGFDHIYFQLRYVGAKSVLLKRAHSALALVNSNLAIDDAQDADEIALQSVSKERFFSYLGAIFGLLAISLTALGLGGSMAYLIIRRHHEIGIRLAMGARPHNIVWLSLKTTVLIVIGGVALGIPGVVAVLRWIEQQYYGVNVNDWVVFSCIAGLIAVSVLSSALIPIRRALRLRPSEILRTP